MRRFLGDRNADVDEEIRHHLDERVERLVEQGWDAETARAEAERRFGDVARIREELEGIGEREERWATMRDLVTSIGSDVGYALRQVRADPTFAAATVSTLALGIGAATAIFAVADALLFRPLPYAHHDRWVQVGEASEDGLSAAPLPADRLRAWQEASDGLVEGWVTYQWAGLGRTDGSQVETLDALAVSPDAHALLGLPVRLGRGLSEEDAIPGAEPVAVLTPRYWDRLGRDPSIVGHTMRLEGAAVTVVGVLRDDTKFPPEGRDIDLWIPMRSDLTFLDRRLGGLSGVWALLPSDLSFEAARARADAVAIGLEAEHPGSDPWRLHLDPVDAGRGAPVVDVLIALGATVCAMFLIALLNGMNLLLVRTTGRTHELGVRVALGASRVRLLRQLALEGAVLGLLAGVMAAIIAWGALLGIRQVLPTIVSYVSPYELQVEARTLLFAFSVAVGAGLALGMLPGIGAVRRAEPSLSLVGRGGADAPARHRLRDGLVVVQVALSLVLLVSAALLINGFARLHAVDVGFAVDRIAIADLEPSSSRYPSRELRADFASRLVAALEATSEIEAVALAGNVRAHSDEPIEAEGVPIRPDQPALVPWAAVSAEYASVMGLRLVEGREFGAEDLGTDHAVVDRDLARFLWADRSPLGLRFRVGDGAWMTVVGVVAELRLIGRDERSGPHQYLTFRDPLEWAPWIWLAMRSSGASSDVLVPVFQRTLRDLDPEQSYWRVGTASERLAFNEEQPRFVLTLMSLLASVAVSLAAIGLYGVLSYAVARRTRELGVRLTLGAEPGALVGSVVREGLATAGVGIVFGLTLALVASAWLERLLYDVPPRDLATYGVVTALFVVIAAVASLLPARRATRVDPVEALKAE